MAAATACCCYCLLLQPVAIATACCCCCYLTLWLQLLPAAATACCYSLLLLLPVAAATAPSPRTVLEDREDKLAATACHPLAQTPTWLLQPASPGPDPYLAATTCLPWPGPLPGCYSLFPPSPDPYLGDCEVVVVDVVLLDIVAELVEHAVLHDLGPVLASHGPGGAGGRGG